MKKELALCMLAVTSITLSCHGTNSQSENKGLAADSAIQNSGTEVYIYRGVFPTKYGLLGIGTMTLHMVEGSGKGRFVYKIDYGEDAKDGAQKLTTYLDSGRFSSESSPEFGDIYVLKGQQSITYNFRPMDNTLTEMGPEKKTETNLVLTGIDPGDSLQTRKQVLAAYRKQASNGDEATVWSSVKNQIITYKDADIKMQSLSKKGGDSSAYIVFNKEQSLAELFLPNATNGIILKRTGEEGNYLWTDGHYELFPWKGYILRYKNGPNIFGGDIQ